MKLPKGLAPTVGKGGGEGGEGGEWDPQAEGRAGVLPPERQMRPYFAGARAGRRARAGDPHEHKV